MSPVGHYEKRPLTIQALQLTEETFEEACAWIASSGTTYSAVNFFGPHFFENARIDIHTLEGTMTARPGDWVVRGIKGEFYPVREDIFHATYVRVEDER